MIIGERVRFRGVERADIPRFVEWLNDPEVRAGILIHHPISHAEEEGWFDRMLARPVDERVMGIEVQEQTTDGSDATWKLIGTCGFDRIDWRVHAAEFGILIGDKSYWNRGHGTGAVRLLVQHGFDTLNLNRIFLHVFETNPRAIRAYEKAGFTLEVRERQAEFKHGKYVDVLLMSMLKDEYTRKAEGI
ncbi:MAG TPA: GNAT family N-acetyltransferase [Anaerolineales bacterium]|nr:GNAT family N-acetyltransferase [Anaerolineales bacterium]